MVEKPGQLCFAVIISRREPSWRRSRMAGGKGESRAGRWCLARRAQHKDARTRGCRGRIAILLTGGEAHDCRSLNV